MLIGDSSLNGALIRGAIWGLRLVAPASIAYCILCPIIRPRVFFHPPSYFFTAWAIAESSFFLFLYLPLKTGLQSEAVHPTPPPEKQRRMLFQRCLDTIADPEMYFSRWFLGAPMTEIKRENVKDFYAWSFMNKRYRDVNVGESAELDGYIDQLEEKFSYKLQSGRGSALGLRGTIEGVYMQHRPIIWYIIVGLVDFSCSLRLLADGYHFNQASLLASLSMVPSRPLSLLGEVSQPAQKISYWYREHTSKHALPVLFIHGVGVGMYAYTSFLTQLKHELTQSNGDGEVGIIAIEILSISARICTATLPVDEMRSEIGKILQKHEWREFVLVGHSYGTAIAASIIRDLNFSARVQAAMLIDPICFLLHLPDVAYNFTRRQPTKASEAMLYYFSSRDPMISHTFARRFFWSQAILWNEDVEGLPLTVILSGGDIIVPTGAVWSYLTGSSICPAQDSPANGDSGDSRTEHTKEWSNDSLRVLWFNKYNHADLFDSKGAVRGVVGVIQQYSAQLIG